jgi:hypothetical protein
MNSSTPDAVTLVIPTVRPTDPTVFHEPLPWTTLNMSPASEFLGWRVVVRGILLASVLAANLGLQNLSVAAQPPGHVLKSNVVSIKRVRERCLELGDDPFANDVPLREPCTAGVVTPRGLAGGRLWYSTVVSRRWLLADSARAAIDTVVELELVLFTAHPSRPIGRDTLIAPVWHYRFEADVLRSVTPEVAKTADGATLVAIEECLNGTGGCFQSFLLERGGRWRDVRMAFLDSLNRRYPSAIRHGYRIDIRTMRGTAPIYSPQDPNCCPSRTAEMRLRLRNGALEIVSIRTVTPDS